MKIFLIDNYDSFTYNLVHLLHDIGVNNIEVRRNDRFELDEIAEYDRLLLSPGPGIPEEAGLMPAAIERYKTEMPILGICLGHQAIVENFGGSIFNMKEVLHGIAGDLNVLSTDEYLFRGLPQAFKIGHYHSWAAADAELPAELSVTARCSRNLIMALAHRELDVRGLQFHPESVLTEQGAELMRNWLGGKDGERWQSTANTRETH